MKKNLKIMALALSAMMAFTVTGCGSSDSSNGAAVGTAAGYHGQ